MLGLFVRYTLVFLMDSGGGGGGGGEGKCALTGGEWVAIGWSSFSETGYIINHQSMCTCVFAPPSWVDPLIWLGFRKKRIKQEDLYDIPKYAISERLQEKFEK